MYNVGGNIVSRTEYVYDAWGNCTVKTDTNGYGSRNPFRYRGYYWDSDLGMYYLITRYYDPKVGRFISADSTEYLEPGTINGLNLYAYCGNNPVMCVDPWGTDVAETHVDGEYDLDEVMYNAGGHAGGAVPYQSTSGKSINTLKQFKTKQDLESHYNDHGNEFGDIYSNSQEYLEGANYVIDTGIYVFEKNGYIKFFGANGGANYAFVGLTRDGGYITTFGIRGVNSLSKSISWIHY